MTIMPAKSVHFGSFTTLHDNVSEPAEVDDANFSGLRVLDELLHQSGWKADA